MMPRCESRPRRAFFAVLSVAIWIGPVSAQPAKSVELKKGQIQFKMGGNSYTLSLSQKGASSLDSYVLQGKKVQTLGLVFEGPKGSSQRANVALGGKGGSGLSGPGKYGKAIIFQLAIQTSGFADGEIYNYSPDDDCTFVFTRLDASGAEGTATCTTAEGKAPFTDMKFTASPG
jgi:hypothetical protein